MPGQNKNLYRKILLFQAPFLQKLLVFFIFEFHGPVDSHRVKYQGAYVLACLFWKSRKLFCQNTKGVGFSRAPFSCNENHVASRYIHKDFVAERSVLAHFDIAFSYVYEAAVTKSLFVCSIPANNNVISHYYIT